MGRDIFNGHVGDPERREVDPLKVPRFDQSHVEYLKATFLAKPAGFVPDAMDLMVAAVSWVAADTAQREMIAHIEGLIAQQKEAAR